MNDLADSPFPDSSSQPAGELNGLISELLISAIQPSQLQGKSDGLAADAAAAVPVGQPAMAPRALWAFLGPTATLPDQAPGHHLQPFCLYTI